MKKKGICMLAFLVAAAAAVTGYGYASVFGGTKVRTASVERQPVSDSYTEDGTINLGDSYRVVSEVSGSVLEVPVSVNQRVKKGDVLYVIDSEDYSYELSSLEAELAGYEAKLNKTKVSNVMNLAPEEYIEDLKKQKESAEAALSSAAANYAAEGALYSTGDVSKTDYEAVKAQYESAEAAYQSASVRYSEASGYLRQLEKAGMSKEDINKAFYNSDSEACEASIEGAKSQIEQLKTRIEKCTVRAEKDGIVSELPVKNLSLVSKGQETAEIKSFSSPSVESDVLTSVAVYLHTGDDVSIKLRRRGTDEVYKGVISEIYDYADKGTSALGTDEYRVHVVIRLKDPGEDTIKSREGYGVNVNYTLYESEDALTVPASSVFESEDRDYVYIIRDGKAVKTEVQEEYRTSTLVVIKDGLSVGDKVIERADDEGIYDGARVRV